MWKERKKKSSDIQQETNHRLKLGQGNAACALPLRTAFQEKWHVRFRRPPVLPSEQVPEAFGVNRKELRMESRAAVQKSQISKPPVC